MLIRKPPGDVYDALVNPDITMQFWFTKSTGKLEVGKSLCWEWEMYAASTTVEVKQRVPGKRIVVVWGLDKNPTKVEWTFMQHGDGATFVSIRNSGFGGDGDSVVEQAMDSAAGFELVLAGLKACLEFGIKLNLVADRFPGQIHELQKPANLSNQRT